MRLFRLLHEYHICHHWARNCRLYQQVVFRITPSCSPLSLNISLFPGIHPRCHTSVCCYFWATNIYRPKLKIQLNAPTQTNSKFPGRSHRRKYFADFASFWRHLTLPLVTGRSSVNITEAFFYEGENPRLFELTDGALFRESALAGNKSPGFLSQKLNEGVFLTYNI